MPTHKPRVLIESPFAGDVEGNVAYLTKCLRESSLRGEAPFASHRFYTLFLDDTLPEEREIGIEAGLSWGQCAERTIVYVDRGISNGMKRGIHRARAEGRPVEFRRLGVETPIVDLGSWDVP